MVEQEKTYVKLRWANKGKEEDETEEEKVERMRVERLAEMEAIKATMVFDQEEMVVDFRKERATNCKHNTAVFFPRPLTAKQEQELEIRRMEWSRIFDNYVKEFTNEKEVQESMRSI